MRFAPEQADAGQLLVQGLRGTGFRVGGANYLQPILIAGGRVLEWRHASLADPSGLAILTELTPRVELLVLGSGRTHLRPDAAVMQALTAWGIGLETMDSRAAARTFNLLAVEGRRVAAALLPLDR